MFVVSVYDSVLFTVLVRISNLCCFGRALYTVYCSSLLFVIVVIVYMTAYVDENSKQQESSIIAARKGLGVSLPVPDVTFVAVDSKNSLAVLFICESQTGLKNLGNLYVSGKLQSILEEHFTSWLKADDRQATVHIKELVWELSDYCRCSLYFNPVLQRELYHGHIS